MAKSLNTFQLLNNNHLIIQFIMQIIKEYITAYNITFQVFYKTSRMPTYYLYKTASIQFTDANIASNIKIDTTDTTSPVT